MENIFSENVDAYLEEDGLLYWRALKPMTFVDAIYYCQNGPFFPDEPTIGSDSNEATASKSVTLGYVSRLPNIKLTLKGIPITSSRRRDSKDASTDRGKSRKMFPLSESENTDDEITFGVDFETIHPPDGNGDESVSSTQNEYDLLTLEESSTEGSEEHMIEDEQISSSLDDGESFPFAKLVGNLHRDNDPNNKVVVNPMETSRYKKTSYSLAVAEKSNLAMESADGYMKMLEDAEEELKGNEVFLVGVNIGENAHIIWSLHLIHRLFI